MNDEKETFPDRLDSYVSAVLDRMDFRPRDRYHPNSEYEKDRARRLRNIVYYLKAELEAENADLTAKLARAQVVAKKVSRLRTDSSGFIAAFKAVTILANAVVKEAAIREAKEST